MQIGAKLICWLADPYDQKIFGMLQAWASAGHMFFRLHTSQGVLIRTRTITSAAPFDAPNFVIPHAFDTARFMRSATDAVSSGLVKVHAKNEIDSVPNQETSRVCGSARGTAGNSHNGSGLNSNFHKRATTSLLLPSSALQ